MAMAQQMARPQRRGIRNQSLASPVGKSMCDFQQDHTFVPMQPGIIDRTPSDGTTARTTVSSYVSSTSSAGDYAHTPTPSEAGDFYTEGFAGDDAAGAMLSFGDFADLASYAQGKMMAPSPNGTATNDALLMQPVFFPVFFPWGGYAMASPAEAANAMPYGAMAAPTEAVAAMPRLESLQVSTAAMPRLEQQREAATQWCRAGAAPAGPELKPGRCRNGNGPSSRKKLSGAAIPQEVEQARHAVRQTMQMQTHLPGPGSCNVPEMRAPQVVPSKALMESHMAVQCNRASSAAVEDRKALTESHDARANDSADPMLWELDGADEKRRQLIFDWVSESFWALALNKRGCRIIQKAIDVGTPAYRLELLENLHGRVHQAMQSPHANYVLQKFIELMPPERIEFIVAELERQVLYVARHRFGCRILQRLVEYCKPAQTEQMISKVLGDSTALLRHQYGNFALQHILQHGLPTQRSAIADVILVDIVRLSKHRLASHVVSSALIHCGPEDVQRLTQALLNDAGQLAQLSRREYGSFVVREVHRALRVQKSNADGKQGQDMLELADEGFLAGE